MEGENPLPNEPSSKSAKRSVLVVTAGLPRSGKSTALNNIFGTDFKSKYSAFSQTKNVDVRCVDGHEDELIVVDTPGLAARDINTDIVKKELEKAIGGLNFVLIYCLSVSPSNSISKADEHVVKNLQNVLGKDVWKKCVLLFTFSDILRHQECPQKTDRDKYKQHLDNHAARFSDLLREICGIHAPKVKAISVVDPQQVIETKQNLDSLSKKEDSKLEVNTHQEVQEILAIPVGWQLSVGREEHLLVTGVKLNWRELAASLIIEKAPNIDRDRYRSFVRDKVTTPLVASIIGATIGFASGATVGLAIGGFGAIPGAAIGAGAGAAAGLLLGGVAGGTSAKMGMMIEKKIEAKRSMEKVNKLKTAQHVKRHSALPILDFSLSKFSSSRIMSSAMPEWKGRPRGYSESGKAQPAHRSSELTAEFYQSQDTLPPRMRREMLRSPESPPPAENSPARQRCNSVKHTSTQQVAREQFRNPEDPYDPEEPEP